MKSCDQPSGLNKMQNSNGSNSHVTYLVYLVYGRNLIRFRPISDQNLIGSEQIRSDLLRKFGTILCYLAGRVVLKILTNSDQI